MWFLILTIENHERLANLDTFAMRLGHSVSIAKAVDKEVVHSDSGQL